MAGADIGATLAGMDLLAKRVDQATSLIVEDVAKLAQLRSIANAPVGRTGNSTNPPGDLRRSIDIAGPVGARGEYRATVGPTVASAYNGQTNYGRQREFGGAIQAKNPSGLLTFKIDGRWIRKPAVSQRGAYYLTRARAQIVPAIDAVVVADLTKAVQGA